MLDDALTANLPLTLGDCGYPITFAWIDGLASAMDFAVTWPGAVKAYRARIEAHPTLSDQLADYLPKLKARLAA